MIHVDEQTGSDSTGTGALETPYQSLAFAFLKHGEASATYLVRPTSTVEYKEPSPTALKKAKKSAEILEKKNKKAQERAHQEQDSKAQERERTERKLEESKAIILKEDPLLPKPIKVR